MIRIIISSLLILSSLVTFIMGAHPVWGVISALIGAAVALWKFTDMEKKGLLA